MVVLPGGPAAKRLRDDARLRSLVQTAARDGKLVAALCAAPIALEAAGVLAGKRATVYPGNELPSAPLIIPPAALVMLLGPAPLLR